MKREAFNHPKLHLLARDLHMDICAARGVIESLWGVTKNCFIRGDIGRVSDEEIAIAMGYTGDETILIQSLLKRKLLDPMPEEAGRLFVHDWHEHAEDWIHMRLHRAGKTFANGAEPKPTRLSRKERKPSAEVRTPCAQNTESVRTSSARRAHHPSPSPSLRTHESTQNSVDTVATGESSSAPLSKKPGGAAADAAKPTVVVGSRREPPEGGSSSTSIFPVKARGGEEESEASPPVDCTALAKTMARTHPRAGRLRAAIRAMEAEHLTADTAEQMVRSHEAYVAYYAQTQPGFVPNLERWISDGDWLRPPPAIHAPRKQPVSETMLLAMELEEEQREKKARRAMANGRGL